MLPIFYSYNDTGAPTLNNAAGSLISVLDACLVSGFNSRTVTNLAVAANVCTATTNVAHGYTVGQRVIVAGAANPILNGDKTILTVPTPTTFTYAAVTPDANEAPGAGSVKRTPLGWLKEFTDTNKAVYKMTDNAAYGIRLRVEDTAAIPTAARVIGVEAPTSIDLYADAFPTQAQLAGGGYWSKGANTAAAKVWHLIGDERFFYLLVENSANQAFNPLDPIFYGGAFGDITSYKVGEGYGTILIASDTGGSSGGFPVVLKDSLGGTPSTSNNARYIARQHTGVLKSIRIGMVGVGSGGGSTYMSASGAPFYPSPVDNGLIFAEPVFVSETLAGANHPIRGTMPGLLEILARYTDLMTTPTIVTATDGSGLKALVLRGVAATNGGNGAIALKMSSAWR